MSYYRKRARYRFFLISVPGEMLLVTAFLHKVSSPTIQAGISAIATNILPLQTEVRINGEEQRVEPSV